MNGLELKPPNKMLLIFADSEAPDKHAHPRRLTWGLYCPLICRIEVHWPISGQCSAGACADLGLCCPHMANDNCSLGALRHKSHLSHLFCNWWAAALPQKTTAKIVMNTGWKLLAIDRWYFGLGCLSATSRLTWNQNTNQPPRKERKKHVS